MIVVVLQCSAPSVLQEYYSSCLVNSLTALELVDSYCNAAGAPYMAGTAVAVLTAKAL